MKNTLKSNLTPKQAYVYKIIFVKYTYHHHLIWEQNNALISLYYTILASNLREMVTIIFLNISIWFE
jgi:hypothetical protein